jgi:hypothetical protein
MAWLKIYIDNNPIKISFQTLSGVLTATQQDGWIELDLPARNNEAHLLPPALEKLFAGSNVHAVYSVDRYIVNI